jgi:hypothetical protein
MMVYDADTELEFRMLDPDEIVAWMEMELQEGEVFDGADLADDLPETVYVLASW